MSATLIAWGGQCGQVIGKPVIVASQRRSNCWLAAGRVPQAHADALEAMQQVLGNSETSPLPKGWTLGGIAYSGSSTYSAGKTETLAVPGRDLPWRRIHVPGVTGRFIPLPGKSRSAFLAACGCGWALWTRQTAPNGPAFIRAKGSWRRGLGTVMVSPVGLWTARVSSDVSGQSKGTEVLLNWTAPIVGDRWMLAPVAGLF